MERFPIEPAELLPEEAHQVEVYYEEPQLSALEFEKKGKKHGGKEGWDRADAVAHGLGSEAAYRAYGGSGWDQINGIAREQDSMHAHKAKSGPGHAERAYRAARSRRQSNY